MRLEKDDGVHSFAELCPVLAFLIFDGVLVQIADGHSFKSEQNKVHGGTGRVNFTQCCFTQIVLMSELRQFTAFNSGVFHFDVAGNRRSQQYDWNEQQQDSKRVEQLSLTRIEVVHFASSSRNFRQAPASKIQGIKNAKKAAMEGSTAESNGTSKPFSTYVAEL